MPKVKSKSWKLYSYSRLVSLTFYLLPFTFCLFFCPTPLCMAQDVVDKMVATVNGGTRDGLITYSDLLWQMALQPGTPLSNPRSDDLNKALLLLEDQRLILQEAEKLPTIAPTDQEVKDALDELTKQFPSQAEFQQRLEMVGLSSDQLREIVRQRVSIDKYLDFRFRSFTVVTEKEIADYYRDAYKPRWQQQHPGVIVPPLEKAHDAIKNQLTESKVESDIDTFLDTARESAEIIVLNPV